MEAEQALGQLRWVVGRCFLKVIKRDEDLSPPQNWASWDRRTRLLIVTPGQLKWLLGALFHKELASLVSQDDGLCLVS